MCYVTFKRHGYTVMSNGVTFAQTVFFFYYGATTLLESWLSRQYPSI